MGGGDAEFRSVEMDVVMHDEVLGQQAHKTDEEFGSALAVVMAADGSLLYVGQVEQKQRVERAQGFVAEAVVGPQIVVQLMHTVT